MPAAHPVTRRIPDACSKISLQVRQVMRHPAMSQSTCTQPSTCGIWLCNHLVLILQGLAGMEECCAELPQAEPLYP